MVAVAHVPFTHFQIPIEEVVLGLITGLTYALLAVGLVMIYKTSRVLNFAHGEMGALGAAVIPWLVIRHGVSYWLAFPLAIAISAAAGAFTAYVEEQSGRGRLSDSLRRDPDGREPQADERSAAHSRRRPARDRRPGRLLPIHADGPGESRHRREPGRRLTRRRARPSSDTARLDARGLPCRCHRDPHGTDEAFDEWRGAGP
jgi:hypothetical protein